ncbi:MAG: DUF4430 domain-containing protein [Nitrososphaeria archaeon]|nr:DUF4430 domain-containing protein [Nitrososphaeria archaeon]
MDKLKLLVIVLILWATFASVFAASYFNRVELLEKEVSSLKVFKEASLKNATVVVVVNFGNGTVFAKAVHYNLDTTFSVLNATLYAVNEKIEYTYSEKFGDVFVTKIFGVENDVNTSRYWMFYVNGELSQTGALKTKVFHNDVIEWRYEKF